jgi:hypothetical protein
MMIKELFWKSVFPGILVVALAAGNPNAMAETYTAVPSGQDSIQESHSQDVTEKSADSVGANAFGELTFLQNSVHLIGLLTLIVALVILVSGLDDLFIDTCYWVRRCYRFLFFRHVYRPPTLEQLTAKPEQSIAIMIPAWHESDVIVNMLETNVKLIQYEHYVFFVGVYQNDPATISEVDRVLTALA